MYKTLTHKRVHFLGRHSGVTWSVGEGAFAGWGPGAGSTVHVDAAGVNSVGERQVDQ